MPADEAAPLPVIIVRSDRPWLAWEAECVRLLRDAGAEVSVLIVPAARPQGSPAARSLAASASRGEHSSLRTVSEPAGLGGERASHIGPIAIALGEEREVRQAAASCVALSGDAWAFDLECSPCGAPGVVLGAMQAKRQVVEFSLVALRSTGDPQRRLHAGATKVVAKSFARTLDAALWVAAGFPVRVIRERGHAHNPGEGDAFSSSVIPTGEPATSITVFRLRCLTARARDALVWLTRHEQWGVGVVRQPIDKYLADQSPAVEWLPACERDRFVADSFAVLRGDTLTLMVEEYPQRTARGILSAFSWREGTRPPARPTPVLELPIHLSYPYLVEDAGSLYCIPETSEAGEVALYRIDQLPSRWTRVATLISGFPALDSTMFRHEGRWWLLAARQTPTQSLELHGWHATALAGPWTPHALNPLKCDIRSSRPAGTPFVHEGRVYRPAQDCSREYGGAVSICRIDRLTPNQFAESVVKTVSPDPRGPYPCGLHTISAVLGASDRLTVIDGKRRVFVPRLFVREIGSMLRRVAGRR